MNAKTLARVARLNQFPARNRLGLMPLWSPRRIAQPV
jgi:hypothetical protein